MKGSGGNNEMNNNIRRPGPKNAAPKPKGAGPAARPRRQPRPQQAQLSEPAQSAGKPDTSGGIKIKLRGRPEHGGLLSTDEIRQQIVDLAQKVGEYPAGTHFKWATFYMTPVDEGGNRIPHEGPRNITMTPYESAADELGA
jgi:hypothetical protein